MTLHSVEVEYRADITGGYRVKVSVLDLGLYMDGFRVTRSSRNESGWWVQPPASMDKNRKWHACPEFDKSKSLWPEIEHAVVDWVNQIQTETEGFEESEPVNLDDVPF